MKQWILVLAIMAAGCMRTVSVATVPSELPIEQAQSTFLIGTVAVSDQREDTAPNYLGIIRSGWGFPLKTMTSDRPVREEVADSFTARLKALGLYDPAGPGVLTVTLTHFDADQLARREALVTFTMAVSRSGQVVYQREESVDSVNGTLLAADTGILGSIDKLRAILVQTMNQAIDQALNRPEFLAAMRS